VAAELGEIAAGAGGGHVGMGDGHGGASFLVGFRSG
jgi:hypothetical protein